MLEAGAEDLIPMGDTFAIHGAPGDFVKLKEALQNAGVSLAAAEVTQVPQNTVPLTSVADARKVIGMLDEMEDHDDVQNVAANYEIPDEVAAQLAEDS